MIRFGRLCLENFGPFAELAMELGHLGLVLVQGENRDTAAASSNGSGKSHIFKAWSWALFGQNADGDKHDQLLRRGAKEFSVALEWADGDERYSVKRFKKSRQPEKLILQKNGADISGVTLKDTQALINERLGMDYRTWASTVFWAQGDGARFADPSVTDAQRKDVLKRVLRLEVLDKAADIARSQYAQETSQRTELGHRRALMETELSSMSSEHLKARLAEAKSSAARSASAAAKVKKLKSLLSDVEDHLSSYDDLKKRIWDLRGAADQDRVRADMLSTWREQERAKVIKQGIERFADGRCPECGTEVESSAEARSTISDLEEELKSLESEISTKEIEASAHRTQSDVALAEAEKLEGELDEFSVWKERRSEIKAEIRNLSALADEKATIRRRIAKLTKELADFSKRKMELERDLSSLKRQIKAAESKIEAAEFWIRGFGNQGIGSYMLDSAMPQLTELANRYLEILSDGDIRVNFDTQSTLKSGATRERLKVGWTIEGVVDTTPSGGQRKKINIATDLALMSLVARRERAAIDLLLIDEVFDGLDGISKTRVMDLLQELRQERGTILAISHDPALSEMFENVVTIVREGGVSKLENGNVDAN